MSRIQTLTQTALLTTVVAGLTYAGSYFYQKWKKQKIPTKWVQIGCVKKLLLYPLKSGNRIELDEAEVTPTGLKQTENSEKVFQLRDRGLVVYGTIDNEFRTARTYPKMMKIDISVHDEEHLALDAPTMRTLYVKIPKRNEQKEVRVKFWQNEKIPGLDCGDEAASWLSRYIIGRDTGLRLAYHDGITSRDITKTHQTLLNYYKNLGNDSTGLYSDLSAILLVNQASVHDLNQQINNATVGCENFRPNIVIDGPNLKPYEEDNWDWIKIGDVILRNVKDCTRCIMVNIDPNTAERNPQMEPLKTLQTYRVSNGPSKSPIMGINCAVRKTGILKIGDPVYVAVEES